MDPYHIIMIIIFLVVINVMIIHHFIEIVLLVYLKN